MEQALKQKGLNPAELLRPPTPDPGCVVYCPRCLAQYTKERDQCTDCGYEELSAFARVAQPPSAVKSSN
jgi:predicted amidophosphoribosyltransferase